MRPRDPRIPVKLQLGLRTADSPKWASGVITDISTTGLFVRTAAVQPVGTKLQLVFWEQRGDGYARTGRVVRVMRVNEDAGIAIKLDAAVECAGASLECLIARTRVAAIESKPASAAALEKYMWRHFGDAVYFHLVRCVRCRIEVGRIPLRGRRDPQPRNLVSRFWNQLRSEH